MQILNNTNPTNTKTWEQLTNHFNEIKQTRIEDLFKIDNQRGKNFSINFEHLYFDYSKNKIDETTIKLFIKLAEECKLKDNINKIKNGELINETENRAVLHWALRNSKPNKYYTNNKNVDIEVKEVLNKMKIFCDAVHEGRHLGYTGKKIKYIVNIGIGGSDLGPLMVVEALKPFWKKDINTYFVSNIDSSHIIEVLKKINIEETIFIIASKTFTTQETLTNANTARKWFLDIAKDENHIKKHFIALSTNEIEVKKFGIDLNNMFEFWNWVGGRYSLWSAIGISIALTIGYENFSNLLQGGESIDEHFLNEPFEKNMPFILAVIGIWHTNFFNYNSQAIIPYYQYLHKFTAYLQQADMESNGKYVDRNNEKIKYNTSPVIWGDAGTNCQHSFFQLLHQGTSIIPCDFIASTQSYNKTSDHQEKLLANFFAQTASLMNGKSKESVIQEASKEDKDKILKLANFKTFEGDRPTNTLLFTQINPFTLGQLISIYENKIMVQGLIWNIYSYDQFGVELGKDMCNKILPNLLNNEDINNYDSSTNNLIKFYKLNK